MPLSILTKVLATASAVAEVEVVIYRQPIAVYETA